MQQLKSSAGALLIRSPTFAGCNLLPPITNGRICQDFSSKRTDPLFPAALLLASLQSPSISSFKFDALARIIRVKQSVMRPGSYFEVSKIHSKRNWSDHRWRKGNRFRVEMLLDENDGFLASSIVSFTVFLLKSKLRSKIQSRNDSSKLSP